MLKDTITFDDIDGESTTKTLYFNLTHFELEAEMELEIIQERFQKFQDEVIGNDPNAPTREMTGPEKREVLGMIKTIIRHAYGVREGKKIVKNQQVWDDFEQTGAFSAYLYWLFETPTRANTFMSGIWPQGVDRPEDIPVANTLSVVPESRDDMGLTVDSTTSEKSWNEYPEEELLSMSEEDFNVVLKNASNGKNVPYGLLTIAMKRNG